MSLFDTGVRPAIDNYLLEESKKLRDYGSYWSASSAFQCMRKNMFERLGVPKVESDADARKQRVFTSGHIFHEWIQGITKKAGLSIAQELELIDEELMIRGHIDDLVLVKEVVEASIDGEPIGKVVVDDSRTNRLILYDYKTVNSRAFLWAKKNGNAMSHYHRGQLASYMYMLRKHTFKPNEELEPWDDTPDGTGFYAIGVDLKNLTEARILKLEKDTLMMSEQQLLWDDQLEKEVLDYWTKLNKYWEAKKLPPCTCADFEGGFLAKEAYNGFYYQGEPCSLAWAKKTKAEGKWHFDRKPSTISEGGKNE